jgi:hypothetical protein
LYCKNGINAGAELLTWLAMHVAWSAEHVAVPFKVAVGTASVVIDLAQGVKNVIVVVNIIAVIVSANAHRCEDSWLHNRLWLLLLPSTTRRHRSPLRVLLAERIVDKCLPEGEYM